MQCGQLTGGLRVPAFPAPALPLVCSINKVVVFLFGHNFFGDQFVPEF